ncbi:MAG: aminodeoxychorismate synthase, component I, partial [Chlorobiaceae bacterium]|nr:aminodeoxychorismate synthase, component I [Chlorobiaceae bacterium]
MNESASGCSFVNGLLTKPGSLWFETAGPGVGGGEALLFTDPVEELQLRSVSDLYDYFSELECRHAAGFFLAGWIGYEAGYGFESGTIGSYCRGMNETFAWFGVYREPRRFFGKEVELFLAGEDDRAFSLPERMRFSYEKQEYADLV